MLQKKAQVASSATQRGYLRQNEGYPCRNGRAGKFGGVLAKFEPRIVRMADARERPDD